MRSSQEEAFYMRDGRLEISELYTRIVEIPSYTVQTMTLIASLLYASMLRTSCSNTNRTLKHKRSAR